MNLKLAANSITCKISPDELCQLEAGERLHLTIGTRPLALALEILPCEAKLTFTATHRDQALRLALAMPPEALAALAALGRNRDGISLQSDGVELNVQVDIRNDKRPHQKSGQAS